MAQPARPPVVQPGTGNNIIVNPCQRGNPILECIRNVGKEFGDVVVDYQVGRTTGILFLSLRYHRLHPEYIHQRIQKLGHTYNLRVLLIMCDVNEHQESIRELTKICLHNNITVMVAWTAEEAGFYLSTYKLYENKPPDLIKERVDKDYNSMLRTSLTSISKVNKTDVETLKTTFGSIADISKASADQLQNLPGFGQVKVKRIKDAFEKPFRNNATSALPFGSQTQTQSQRSTSAQNTTTDTGAENSTTRRVASSSQPIVPAPSRPPREPSPEWDLELDLNASPTTTPPPPEKSTTLDKPKRAPSPEWDIEDDIEIDDDETFGQSSLL
ncbi:hypothetical protein QCA50_004358 [Cerrena zonata]|uniref:DNA excision repair protein ERCC-1 n=1 Tax=Cerrena zonata TaxID=2478898 RepID=A0AAW0GTS4_9APHY